MNLLIIGHDVDDIAKEVWVANTNYTILNMSPFMWGKDFEKLYKKSKDLIVVSTEHQFVTRGIDDFIELMRKYKFTPVFITNDKDSVIRCMHTAVEDDLEDAILYFGDKSGEKYPEFIGILQDLLKMKG